jgi:hypothetical protein
MKWYLRIALLLAGFAAMFVESRYRDEPGFGFAICLILWFWAVLAGSHEDELPADDEILPHDWVESDFYAGGHYLD